jgi:uncharacterized protein
VVMRFNNNPARLSIPYTAIKAFWDNSQLKCSNN